MTADARDDDSINALPAGTRFGELEILGTLGVGGFGIVYLARDHALEREVAIKEYMPSQFAQRDGQSQVSVRSMSMKETFELGRRSFVNEARLLARFDHPSLLKVYRFWEANGTAYMAMPRLVGQNLREARKAQSTPPPEAWTRRIFDAVLGGLAVLHAQHVWHRDVAPDNIFLPADGGPPILLDFGAARQAIGDHTQVFTAILKPSYAPIEQYAEATSLKQGPWTDFYALAAAMHDLLTGRPPPPCTARAMGDELAPLAVPGYSPGFLAALDWALRVPPHQRPQSAAAWREVIEGRSGVPAARSAPPAAAPQALDLEFADTVQAQPPEAEETIVVPAPGTRPQPPQSPNVKAPPAAVVAPPGGPAAAAQRPKAWLFVAAGVVALLLLGFFVMQLRGSMDKQAPAAQPQAQVGDAAASAVSAVARVEPAASVAVAPSAPAVQPAASSVQVAAAPALSRTTPAAGHASAASTPPRRDGALRPAASEKITELQAMPRSPVSVAPEPVAPSPAVVSAKPATAAANETEPRSPTEACGRRVLLALAWCIDRQCERPLFQNHPECVKLREIRNSQRAP
ncbi:serine/threonine protein kinase [Roseateles saccharophilus]|uniref:non-specific serine/threonine protein kinase n=1 Tax=Roseateles saccharophilus TaxID=304 RepID=A0A4R3UBM9_ROSSA|nr:serine/threonine-protein kinase [Roseateles saccharophilus]MDG0835623.1 serine/threonine protein kinase [Roseateles saccharophilus]TCU85130.1 non-specific serine/threonine protein kinase [Roseateles saccharophilus]